MEGLTRDDVLDNVTLFWLTNTGVSAARLYWENKLGFFTPKGVKVPMAASAFPWPLRRLGAAEILVGRNASGLQVGAHLTLRWDNTAEGMEKPAGPGCGLLMEGVSTCGN